MTDMFKPTVEALNESVKKTMKTAEEMFAFGRGNLEALTASGEVLAAGARDLGNSIAAEAKARMEATVAAMESFAAVKSMKELVDLQTAFARTSMEKAAAETSRVANASQKIAADAIAPITARATAAVEMLSHAA